MFFFFCDLGQNVSTSLPMVTHFIIQLFQEERDINQMPMDYLSCPINLSKILEETENPIKRYEMKTQEDLVADDW